MAFGENNKVKGVPAAMQDDAQQEVIEMVQARVTAYAQNLDEFTTRVTELEDALDRARSGVTYWTKRHEDMRRCLDLLNTHKA